MCCSAPAAGAFAEVTDSEAAAVRAWTFDFAIS
jgi:hypothetical protein